jgi:hypothetical protein
MTKYFCDACGVESDELSVIVIDLDSIYERELEICPSCLEKVKEALKIK